MSSRSALLPAFAALLAAASLASAQPGGRGRGPTVVSPEVKPDGHVTFRILAPKAEKVTLSANDITVLFCDGGAGPLPAPTSVRCCPPLRCRKAGLSSRRTIRHLGS